MHFSPLITYTETGHQMAYISKDNVFERPYSNIKKGDILKSDYKNMMCNSGAI
jgi:hypothetical protein